MSKLDSVFGIIDAVSEWSGKIICYLAMIILLLTLIEVFRRYVLNDPTVWATEVTGYLCGLYFMFAGAYVLRHKAHVNMDILYNRFSPKGRAILDLITSVLFFAFISALVWKGFEVALYSLRVGEVTFSRWEMPTFWVKMCIPIAAFLILLQGISIFRQNLLTALSKGESK